MRALIRRLLPGWLKASARHLAREARIMGWRRWCPVCRRWCRGFEPAGIVPRPDARCPRCGSLERHRLLWLFLEQRTDLLNGDRRLVLHVAPEKCFAGRLRRRLGRGYITGDLQRTDVCLRLDVTHLPFAAAAFDAIYCSHVLEHVPDDRAALAEFRRVLRPGGWAILLVPITRSATFEDPSVCDPGERLRLFGQADHVRCYGQDYAARLRQAGFQVAVTTPLELLPATETMRQGLSSAAGEIYYCTVSEPAA